MEENSTPRVTLGSGEDLGPCLWCQQELGTSWIMRASAFDSQMHLHEFGMHLHCYREMVALRASRRRAADAR